MVVEKKKKSKKKNASVDGAGKQGEIPQEADPQQRFRLRHKSKTMSDIDLRRRKSTDAGNAGDPDLNASQFERKQSSFRKRINTFLQNSPFLKRASFIRPSASLKTEMSRMSDSMESLKIDENRVANSDSKLLKAYDEAKRLYLRKTKSRSCDQFTTSTTSLNEFANCHFCSPEEDSRAQSSESCFTDKDSLASLPAQVSAQTNRNLVRRSVSLQFGARTWGRTSVPRLNMVLKHFRHDGKATKGSFCTECGIPLYCLNQTDTSFEVSSGAGINTLLSKDSGKKPKKARHLSPEHVEPGKGGNEVKTKTQEWTRKLVGSIRKKVKPNSQCPTASNPRDWSDKRESFDAGTQEEALESSGGASGPSPRKASLSGWRLGSAEGAPGMRGGGDRAEGDETPEPCPVKRKLSFPCAAEGGSDKESKGSRRRDTTLLGLLFRKQSSVDVRRCPSAAARDKQKRAPELVVSGRAGSERNSETGNGNRIDITVAAEPKKSLPEAEADEGKSRFDNVAAPPRTMSRSCGQVEMVSADPAVRENFLQATMSIFLAVSPTSKIQVRSRSLTHIDQIQSKPTELFLKEMNCDKGTEQLLVPAERSKSSRPMLSRSEASSSECFSVGFEGLQDDAPDEFVQTSKNTILRDALLDLCKPKGVELGNSNVFLDANKSPLPCLDIDTSWMAGKHIRIKVNDRVTGVRKDTKNSFGSTTPLKKISSNYRSNKSGSRTHNVSSEESSLTEPGPSSKSAKRWSGFFGTSRDTSKMETLVDLLDSYTKNGMYEYEDTYKLESDWKSIVTNTGSLEDRHSQQQEAIWELLRSEIDYIKMLRVVSQLFIACLVNLQSNQLLLEIDNKKLFGNVEEVYSCNDAFWKRHLMPVVESSRKTGDPLNPEHLKEGFLNFASFFKCYETYCSLQSRCQHYCREKLQQDQDNELFTAYLAWCETQKECNRLKLLDILVKPMQRLTKYSLLLKAILKHTSNPSHRDSLIAMIRNVDLFVNQVNSTLKQNQDLETMKQLMAKIESYEVVETKDDDLLNLVQKYSNLNLTYDMPETNHKRSLLFELDLKYKDAMTSSKIEVHAFLFTDMLLLTKPIKRLGESKVKFRIIRQPFVVDKLVTQEIARDPPTLACVYLSIYQTACSAFVLSCNEMDLIKNLSDAIKKARTLYESLKANAEARPLQPPSTLPISRQQSGYADEDAVVGDIAEESKGINYTLGLWAGRSPRGSSKGSRMSSLVHSHSGSMEMTENASSMSSISASRGISVENNSEIRGSSLSSDDGNTNLAASPRGEKRESSPHAERRDSPASPRPESKSLYRKANTKSENTLTIHVPHLGQSLPNLSIASNAGSSNPNPSPPNSLLLAPPKSHGGLLSPSQRGVSYPPPSPPRGSLKRGFAISPRNPPLLKTGHVTVELSKSMSSAQPPVEAVEKQAEERTSKTIGLQTNLLEGIQSQAEGNCEKCTCNNRATFMKPNGKKLMRSDKRYYTAGTIDDLKAKKDANIHKRLSFNSDHERHSDPTKEPTKTKKHIGLASVQSLSGFSPVGSNVERLFLRDEATAEGARKTFKFDEILYMISLENEDSVQKQFESTGREPLSDLELFESKVSQWQKYGYREEEPQQGASGSRADAEIRGRLQHSGRDSGKGNSTLFGFNSSSGSKETKQLSENLAGHENSLSLLVKALQLEHARKLSYNMPSGKGGGRKRKRKRSQTI